MNRSLRANLLLTLTALIWGVAFVAQDVAADRLGPFSFNGLRMALAALALVPVVLVMDRRAQAAHTADVKNTGAGVPVTQMPPAQRKTLLTGGLCCGVMLTLGSAFQQLGISMGTGAGKAGFITALYIVLVPVTGLFARKRVRKLVWAAVALSAVGLYLLCIKGGFAIDPGDGMLMLCALSFSGHILAVDFFSRKTDCVKMSCIQFAVVSILCLIGAACTEQLTWQAVRECAVPILYAGVLSCGVAYTLQVRDGLYPTNCGPKGYRPHGRLAADVPGKRVRRAGGLGDPWRRAQRARAAGLRVYDGRHRAGAAARELIFPSPRKKNGIGAPFIAGWQGVNALPRGRMGGKPRKNAYCASFFAASS